MPMPGDGIGRASGSPADPPDTPLFRMPAAGQFPQISRKLSSAADPRAWMSAISPAAVDDSGGEEEEQGLSRAKFFSQ